VDEDAPPNKTEAAKELS